MPYVDQETRDRLDHGHPAHGVGELTYLLQQEVQRYLLVQQTVAADGQFHYSDLAAVLGALDGCRSDFIDRILLPYEAVKAATNGDVWEPQLIATNRIAEGAAPLDFVRRAPHHEPVAVMAESRPLVSCVIAHQHLPHDWYCPDHNVIYHCPGA